jgi:hypothetical protein
MTITSVRAPLHGFAPLSITERLDVARYEDSFGDFTAAAWHHAGGFWCGPAP